MPAKGVGCVVIFWPPPGLASHFSSPPAVKESKYAHNIRGVYFVILLDLRED